MERAIYHQPDGSTIALDVITPPEKNAAGVVVASVGLNGVVLVANAPVYAGYDLPKPGCVVLDRKPEEGDASVKSSKGKK